MAEKYSENPLTPATEILGVILHPEEFLFLDFCSIPILLISTCHLKKKKKNSHYLRWTINPYFSHKSLLKTKRIHVVDSSHF